MFHGEAELTPCCDLSQASSTALEVFDVLVVFLFSSYGARY